MPIESPLNVLKLFVYGTLKPGEINYQRFCVGRVVDAYSAIALGQLFVLSLGYPAMTQAALEAHRRKMPSSAATMTALKAQDDKPAHIVYGFVLTLKHSAVLQDLDRLEDYDPARPREQNLYERCQIETFDLEHQPLGLAWVYLMSPEKIDHLGGILISGGQWIS